MNECLFPHNSFVHIIFIAIDILHFYVETETVEVKYLLNTVPIPSNTCNNNAS